MTKATCKIHGSIEAMDLDPHMPAHNICPVCFANWSFRKFGVKPDVVEPTAEPTFPFPYPPDKQGYDLSKPSRRAMSSCGYCKYEESDGELLEQCDECKAFDAAGAPL